jgi:glycosyltransferase involved in cell wall biosynthesis
VSGVLWVTTELTARPRSGGTLRTLRLLAAVAERMPVDAVVIGADDPYDGELPVRSIRRFPGRWGIRARLTAARHRWPVPVARGWDDGAAAYVRARADRNVTVIDHVWSAEYRPRALPYVLHLHNLERDVVAPLPGWSPRAVESRVDAALRLRRESALVRDPRARVITVSDRDAEAVPGRALVVPNGTDYPGDITAVPEDGPYVFVGACDYPPNIDAVAWWANDVWPLLRDQRPLHVAGRRPEALGDLNRHPAVHVVGEVDDVGPVIDTAGLVVVPLRHGGGTRLKVLEALAHGRPVLSTTKGAEGLPLGEDAGVVRADDAAALAAAADALSGEVARRRQLGAAGRVASAAYDWRVVAGPFVDLVASLSTPRGRAAPRPPSSRGS